MALQVYLGENATMPTKGSTDAAGYDLYAAEYCCVEPRGKALIKTNIKVIIPEGCYGRIAPRSGLAWKNHIDVGAGVIDRDYRGWVGVVLFNHSEDQFVVNKGDRIAQFIMEQYMDTELFQIENFEENTSRGEGGFGSTGK